MAIRRCPYCKAIIDESQKYCNNCGTQLLFPDDETGEEPIKGEKIVDEDFPGNGEDRIPEDLIDEPREDIEIDVEPEEERKEIDLEKVIEGEASLDEDEAGDSGLTDLREAEPAPEAAGAGSEEIRIEKPVPGPEESGAPRREKPLSRKKQGDGRKSLKLPPPKRGVTPPAEKIKGDPNTNFEISRLIADFEKRRRNYTAELELPPAEEPVEEPLVPPTAEEVGEPPKPEELEKAADALREGTAGDFATDYELAPKDEPSETENAEERKGPTDDRISRLVGGFKAEVESAGEAEEEPESHTRHPEFMTGDLIDDRELKEQPEPHPAFVTTDFEAPPEPEALPARDLVIQNARREFGSGYRREEPFAPEPAVQPQAPADERSVLIARILKKRAEKMVEGGESRVSRETSEALAALKSTNAAELAKPDVPEEAESPEEKPEVIKEPEERGAIPPTGEIQKPVEEEEEGELPPISQEELGELRTDDLMTPSEELPSLPTMGIPEALPKTPPPLPFEAPAEAEVEEEEQEEQEEEEEEELRLEPEPAAPPVGRRLRIREAEPETVPSAPIIIEETPQREEPEAPDPCETSAEKPSVRAPVVRLGFFRRIKATIFDLLVVGAFWAVGTAVTAHFLSIPVLDLIISAALPLGLLYGVLLTIYLFMFLLFLGETPGGRLAAPRN